MNLKTQKIFQVGQCCELGFHITESMVKQFAQLIGDYNALHVDPIFGRRSIYRKNVAHGMLTIAHLSLLDFFYAKDCVFSVQHISTNFLKPVFFNENLVLKAEIKNCVEQENKINLEFTVKKKESGVVVAIGECVLSYAEFSQKIAATESVQDSMVLTPLQENCLEFDQIDKGQVDQFSFVITQASSLALRKLLLEGVGQESLAVGDFNGNFLASLLFSTFAGMCIPGRYATFTGFAVSFNQAIEWGCTYDLVGEVLFKSSVGTISEKIEIKESGKKGNVVCAEGKMDIQVNSAPIEMPSIEELRDSVLDLQLKNKVVLITGASRGIGETTAKLFALHGAKVVVNYLSGKDDAQNVVQQITELGGEAIALQADVTSREQVKAMFQKVQDKFQRLDILVNSAVGDFTANNFTELNWDDVQKDIDIIVKGAFNCCQEAIFLMKEVGGGKIINMSTIATDNPPANHSKYVVAKSALVGLTRSLALELAPLNIQINMVVPSMVETDLTAASNKMIVNSEIRKTPMKRLASSVDVARSIIYLASSLNSFTTGQKIMVTGGNAPFL